MAADPTFVAACRVLVALVKTHRVAGDEDLESAVAAVEAQLPKVER